MTIICSFNNKVYQGKDPKIIFLTRDPRGIFQSKVGIYDDLNGFTQIMSSIYKVCDGARGILSEIQKSEWLRERSLIVRYEDVAMNPEDSAKVTDLEA